MEREPNYSQISDDFYRRQVNTRATVVRSRQFVFSELELSREKLEVDLCDLSHLVQSGRASWLWCIFVSNKENRL